MFLLVIHGNPFLSHRLVQSMRNYVDRLFPTKEALSAKGSIHMVHGT